MTDDIQIVADAVFAKMTTPFDDCACTSDADIDRQLIAEAIAVERERCAKIADSHRLSGGMKEHDLPQFKGFDVCAKSIADKIRGKDRGSDLPQAETK